LWDKLESATARIPELERLLSDPSVTGNPREMQRVGRELAELRPVAVAHARYRKIEQELADNRALQDGETDPAMKAMVREEIDRLTSEKDHLAEEIRALLVPKDPNDEKNILIEIRAGAVGDLGQGIRQSPGAHVMDGENRVRVGEGPAPIDDFLGAPFHFRIASLHRIKIQCFPIGTGIHAGSRATTQSNQHTRPAQLNQQGTRWKFFLAHMPI